MSYEIILDCPICGEDYIITVHDCQHQLVCEMLGNTHQECVLSYYEAGKLDLEAMNKALDIINKGK